ncbi:MAG: hypothetical protein HYT62_02080 [Candidatus Yanofskybacteria bacterium]|nr:hypothetical protein [Candidatus Yanofskybacteria bacterium]
MKWEQIEFGVFAGCGISTDRARIPDGWIVRMITWKDSDPIGISSEKVYDPAHTWDPRNPK